MTISWTDLTESETMYDVAELLHENGHISQELCNTLMSGFFLRPASYKASLVDVPFMIVRVTIMNGIDNTTFAELMIIDANNRKATIRDSSLGIHEQIKEMYNNAAQENDIPMWGIWVRKGLTTVERTYHDANEAKDKIAVTYLLNM